MFFSLVSASPRSETGKTPSYVFSFLEFWHQGGEKGKKKKRLLFFFFFFFFFRGGKGEKKEPIFVPPLFLLFHLCLRGSHHLVRSMAKEERTPTADVKIAKKSLLPLQDPWYCSSPLFPMVPTDISASKAPSQRNIRGEAPNPEIAWVPSPPGVMDLRLQRKELLTSPMQFWCPSGLING